jgi:hypothetical protein
LFRIKSDPVGLVVHVLSIGLRAADFNVQIFYTLNSATTPQ